MSIEQLTSDERASFLLGQALRRVMLDQTVPAGIRAQAWAGYAAACDHGMPSAEAVEIRTVTRLIDLSGQWLDPERDGDWIE